MDTVRPSQEEILHLAQELARRFAERAAKHDQDGSFPYENFDDLRAAGFPLLTVPVNLGGWGAGLLESVKVQEQLAQGDGSTALAMTMHTQTIGAAASSRKWENDLFPELCQEIVTRGALVNSCATEPELGSPSRGGRPATTAHKDGDEWVINGRKSFASMSPVLDYFILPAVFEGEDRIASFLTPRQDGIKIENTWDTMGMRSTGSNDVILENVRATDHQIISVSSVGFPDPNKAVQNAWFVLTVSAVYLGIAVAAQKVACQFAHDRVPTALGKPIASLESIQRRLGESELSLQVARRILYDTAAQWDSHPEDRDDMGAAVMIAKLTVTNNAIKIVDDSMRVVGGTSMTHGLPLERYYRDVRAGLYHPPADDSTLPLLGRLALGRIKPL